LEPDGVAVNTEEVVIREADAQVGELYETLRQSGFFEHGVLFVTGDHRAMEPFSKAEFDRFGSSAIARIPAVIATRAFELPSVIEQDFQQADLGGSILAAVTGQRCRGQGTLVSKKRPQPWGLGALGKCAFGAMTKKHCHRTHSLNCSDAPSSKAMKVIPQRNND
jgi:hypothetical protein